MFKQLYTLMWDWIYNFTCVLLILILFLYEYVVLLQCVWSLFAIIKEEASWRAKLRFFKSCFCSPFEDIVFCFVKSLHITWLKYCGIIIWKGWVGIKTAHNRIDLCALKSHSLFIRNWKMKTLQRLLEINRYTDL